MTRANPKFPVLRSGGREPAAPQQARSSAKRAKLLEAGRRLLGEKGYEATSIADITRRAGTAAGAFYVYFSSKRQFLVVLMNELLERLGGVDLRPVDIDLRPASEKPRPNRKPRANRGGGGGRYTTENLRAFLAAVFRVDVHYFGVVRAWKEASLADSELGRMQREIERWTGGRVLSVFERLAQHSNARRGRDLAAFARMMDRHFWSLLAGGSRMTSQEFDREVDIAADVIYSYLFRDL